ncbi:MAG: hypothetical protein RIB52_06815 [Erythrobacter sp.]|uniref:hypothetical protein n=1 Tax=Erythrobacter sp. TaxID=1042 RepID=UPI0032ED092D
MKPGLLFIIALALGLALWTLATFIDGVREPWDGGSFWIFYVTALALAAMLGVFAERLAWLAGAAVIFAMLPVMLVATGVGSLIVLGVILLAFMALPAIATAQVAFALAHRKTGNPT